MLSKYSLSHLGFAYLALQTSADQSFIFNEDTKINDRNVMENIMGIKKHPLVKATPTSTCG
jgi:hypothetical protein